MGELRGVARKLLPERQWRSVHEVGAANFNYVFEFLGFGLQRVAKFGNAGNGQFGQNLVGRNVHGRRKGVVGRLRLIDVVVGVQEFLLVRKVAAVRNVAPVGDDLIGVHVRLRTRTRLPHNQRKLVVELSVQNFVADFSDQFGFFFIQNPGFGVGERGGFFEVGEGFDDFLGHLVDVLGDGEVLDRALRLRAPIHVGGYLYLAHGVFFYAIFQW